MEKATQLAQQTKESIDRFVDTVKLKAHLASMDSKDAWQKIEGQFEIIKNDIKEFTEAIKQDNQETKLQAHLALMDAKERWEVLKAEMDQFVASVDEGKEKAIDHAKVKLSLAKLEAKDFFDRNQYRDQFNKLEKEIKEDWYGVLSRMDERIVDFINRFPLR